MLKTKIKIFNSDDQNQNYHKSVLLHFSPKWMKTIIKFKEYHNETKINHVRKKRNKVKHKDDNESLAQYGHL